MSASQETHTDKDLLTIGALAKACGVTVRTLRYYEEMDLIGPVKRSAGKYRLYNERSLKRVNAILSLQDLNYSLEQIVDMLGPYSEAQSYDKAQRVAATRDSLNKQRELVDEKLVSLKDIRDTLEERLELLEEACEPCVDKEPHKDCSECCEYRDIHLN